MDKSWYQSKTIWGFGIAAVIAIGQIFNVPVAEGAVASLVEIISAFVGLFGLRSAID